MTEQEIHKLGEVLRSAREARGVDLARVERDTKIRSRYLSALERGEYRELPGAVYTKGFLRNYGSYLGLDTDYLIDLYRLESSTAPVERPSAPVPPRPIAGRRSRALVVTPGALLAALLTVGVAVFIVYLVSEFVTFAGTPELRVVQPAGDISGYLDDEYTFRGVTEPNAHVRVDGLRENPSVTADEDGSFEITVSLVPGSNVVTLVATDPLTGRDSAEVRRTIIVGEGPSPSLAPPVAVLEVATPEEGATLNGPVAISGTAAPDATVTVGAVATGPAPASFRVQTLAGDAVTVPSSTPPAPEPLVLTAGADGAFEGSLSLPPAAWNLTLVADGTEEEVARAVSVAVPEGLSGTLRVEGSRSYLEIDQDGEPMDISGDILEPGAQVALAARETLRIRVGNAAAVRMVINGIELGPMGAAGAVVEWRVTRL